MTSMVVTNRAADGDTFGNEYPSSPSPNSSIFTFQNIDPQKQSASHPTSQLNSSQFSRGNASISLFAEHCLNEAKLPHCNTFNPRMRSKSKHSFSYILTNNHESPTAGWNLVGGTGFTMNSLFCWQNKLNHGGGSTRLKTETQQPCAFMLHTAQSKIYVIRVGLELTLRVFQWHKGRPQSKSKDLFSWRTVQVNFGTGNSRQQCDPGHGPQRGCSNRASSREIKGPGDDWFYFDIAFLFFSTSNL